MRIKHRTCYQQMHFSHLHIIFDPLLPSICDLGFAPPPHPLVFCHQDSFMAQWWRGGFTERPSSAAGWWWRFRGLSGRNSPLLEEICEILAGAKRLIDLKWPHKGHSFCRVSVSEINNRALWTYSDTHWSQGRGSPAFNGLARVGLSPLGMELP